MPNELLWFLTFFLDFLLLLLVYKHLGKTGLYAWIVMMTILANLQVQKTIELFGAAATLGNVAYASTFLATDILSEHYGKQDAKIAVRLGFLTMIVTTTVMITTLLFTPMPGDQADEALRKLFLVMPRLGAASIAAYVVSQFHDVFAYHYIKTRFPSHKYLWLRNNGSTLVSQLLDTAIFTTIAFYGVFPKRVFLSIVLTTYLIKAAAALLDTPFLYIASWMKQKGLVTER